MPFHLIFPLVASIVLVLGLMLNKRAISQGANAWAVTFTANLWAAAVFSSLWALGGTGQPASMLWQPVLVGVLYILGQTFTFLAIERGDVSVATPVFSLKVLAVALLVVVLAGERVPQTLWLAAVFATVGIALVQHTDRSMDRSRLGSTIAFALLAGMCFALFDVLIQIWAPRWGTGRFLPVVFWSAALLSLGYARWMPSGIWRRPQVAWPLLAGSLLISLQALSIVYCLAAYGDAARVNIVYSLRALWGVLLAWLFSRLLDSGEAHTPRRVMVVRCVGACLLTAAVIVAILKEGSG